MFPYNFLNKVYIKSKYISKCFKLFIKERLISFGLGVIGCVYFIFVMRVLVLI